MVDQEASQPRKRLRTTEAAEQAHDAESAVGSDAAAAAPVVLAPVTVVGATSTAPAADGCVVAAPSTSLGVGMGMGVPCNGCGCCGTLGSNPGMMGIMQQQQQQYMMQQMGMFNHMMMMGAMMGPLMGQMVGPMAAPADGTAMLPSAGPATLQDPAVSASKLKDEDDEDSWHSFSTMLGTSSGPGRSFEIPQLRYHPGLRQISTTQTIDHLTSSRYQVTSACGQTRS